MAANNKTPLAGGFLLCISLLAGALIGAFKGQSSIGILVGAGIGFGLAILIWLADGLRRRGRR